MRIAASITLLFRVCFTRILDTIAPRSGGGTSRLQGVLTIAQLSQSNLSAQIPEVWGVDFRSLNLRGECLKPPVLKTFVPFTGSERDYSLQRSAFLLSRHLLHGPFWESLPRTLSPSQCHCKTPSKNLACRAKSPLLCPQIIHPRNRVFTPYILRWFVGGVL